MRPEEKLHRAIWSALDEIAQEKLATPNEEWVFVSTTTPNQKRAIRTLEKCGAVKIVKNRMRPYHPLRVLQEMQGVEEEPIGYYIDIIEPRYSEALDFYYDNVGKRNEGLIKSDVVKVTDQLKAWQGSKPTSALPQKSTIPAGKMPEKKIEKLTIVEKAPNAHSFKVLVNDDYQTPLPFDSTKNSGGLLLKLAERKGPIMYAEHKQPFDHLNSTDSQLLTKTGCVRTKILTSEAGYIEPTIEIETITEKQFKQRSGKAPKNT